MSCVLSFFFFQAEDGIRDLTVTGVQTCALPISAPIASSRSTDPVDDNQPVLVLIGLDPRASHRANEAMRIGLGVVSGENEVTFVLRGPGVHLLDADTDELVDGDDIAKFRGNLKALGIDRKSTRLNSSHSQISYAVFCLKKKKQHVYSAAIAHTHCL